MTYEQILTEVRGRVGIIRLNWPSKLNAWTGQLTAWNDDPAVGAIVLTGEGRAFCAGADIGGFLPDHIEAVTAFREKREARFNK